MQVFVLGIMAIVLRGVAAYCLRFRAKRENRLDIILEEKTELRIQSIVVAGQSMEEMKLSIGKAEFSGGPPSLGPKQGWQASGQKVDAGVRL